MTAEQVLKDHGIVRPAEVVKLAANADLELAAAAALLIMESGGGRNVWGHDKVNTGGIYTPGAEVTKAVYLKYKAQRHASNLQGVGPMQLTSAGFQDRADDAGGCWVWEVNCAVGFDIVVSHIKSAGDVRDGFRRYNGSGKRAESYADTVMGLVKIWRKRLAGLDTTTSTPSIVEDDIMISAPPGNNAHIDIIVRDRTKLYLACSYNEFVDVLQLDFWGDTPNVGANGNGVGGGRKQFRLDSNRPGPITIPAHASMATIRYNAKHSFAVGAV